MSNKEISIGVKLVTDLNDFITGFKKAQDTSAKFGETVDKKINSPLKAMQAEFYKLKNAQRNSLSMEQYQKIGKEIDHMQGMMDLYKGKIKQTSSPLNNMLAQAKGLLPAFGFAAIAGGAVAAFGAIKNSTDTMKTDWEAMTNGMNEGLNEFWRTIATGDWSNFTERIKEAIAMGEKYVYTLDDIEDKTRSLSIRESEAQGKIIDLEIALKNKTLSKADRLKAGQERIQLEKDLAADREKVAQETFDNEADLTATQTKLSKEQLMTVMRDMDSATKIRAKAYNDQIDQLEKLKRANVRSIGGGNAGGGTLVALADTQQMIDLKNQIDQTSESTKLYADQIKATGRTSDEQLDKMVASYGSLLEAQNSARGNIKKVENQVNTLLAGEEENGNKLIDKTNSLDSQIKVLKDSLDSVNKTDIESIQIIGAKITALEKLKQAYANIASDPASFRSDTFMQITPITKAKVSAPIDPKNKNYRFDNMGDSIDANTERLARFREEWQAFNDQPSNLEILSGQFDSLGNSIGGAAGSFLNMVSTILGLIPMLIAQIAALTTAQVTSSATVTTAKSTEAIAAGTAASQSVPFPLNLIALAVTIGSIVAALATGVKGFAVGGVVPGSSFTGDKVLARVNSGEEILTASDPRHRNNRGATSSGGGSNISILSEAKIKGEDLYILLKKAEQRINRRT